MREFTEKGCNMHAEDLKMLKSQQAKQDLGKLDLSLVPSGIIKAIAKIRMYGNRKYPDGGKDNWKQVEADRHWKAVLRHVEEARGDFTKIDPESGYPHIYHAACDLAFVIDLMEGKAND